MEPAEKRKWTPDEYLAMERESDVRHEYLDGEIFAMAGASPAHERIVASLVGELHQALRRRPCNVYSSNLRVKVSATGLYTYPDVTVACGEEVFEEEAGLETLTNPLVVFEVLSDSTEKYDRGAKFEQYRRIPSLGEIVLVSQEKKLVEEFVRQPDGGWLLHERRGGDRLSLPALGVEIDVEEIYLKVFAPPGEAAQG